MRLPGYTYLFKRFLYPLYNNLVGRDMFGVARERVYSEKLSPEEIRDIQFRKLKTILVNAYERVPYYRCKFRELHFDPVRLETLEEFENLDFYITKADVKANPDLFIADDCSRRKLRWHHTGGSTGEPLFFPTDPATDAASASSMVRVYRWWGIELGERHAMFWGSPTFIIRRPADYIKKIANTIRNSLMNRFYISNYNLNEKNIAQYRDRLESFRPSYVRGMPSSLYVFARSIIEKDKILDKGAPKVVFSACEQLFDWQKSVIEKGFSSRVVNTYGVSELAEIAYEAPCGNMHLMDEDVLVELKDFGMGENEIVGTQLNNTMSPLIRYRTGDIAERIESCNCELGLNTLRGLKGRAHDFIVAPDGHYLHGQLFTHLIVFESGVVNYQVRQTSLNEIIISMVIDSNYSLSSEDALRKGIGSYMGSDVSVSFKYVSSIPLTQAGKHRWIISDVTSSV